MRFCFFYIEGGGGRPVQDCEESEGSVASVGSLWVGGGGGEA